jgi:hypothetical protein
LRSHLLSARATRREARAAEYQHDKDDDGIGHEKHNLAIDTLGAQNPRQSEHDQQGQSVDCIGRATKKEESNFHYGTRTTVICSKL